MSARANSGRLTPGRTRRKRGVARLALPVCVCVPTQERFFLCYGTVPDVVPLSCCSDSDYCIVVGFLPGAAFFGLRCLAASVGSRGPDPEAYLVRAASRPDAAGAIRGCPYGRRCVKPQACTRPFGSASCRAVARRPGIPANSRLIRRPTPFRTGSRVVAAGPAHCLRCHICECTLCRLGLIKPSLPDDCLNQLW